MIKYVASNEVAKWKDLRTGHCFSYTHRPSKGCARASATSYSLLTPKHRHGSARSTTGGGRTYAAMTVIEERVGKGKYKKLYADFGDIYTTDFWP